MRNNIKKIVSISSDEQIPEEELPINPAANIPNRSAHGQSSENRTTTEIENFNWEIAVKEAQEAIEAAKKQFESCLRGADKAKNGLREAVWLTTLNLCKAHRKCHTEKVFDVTGKKVIRYSYPEQLKAEMDEMTRGRKPKPNECPALPFAKYILRGVQCKKGSEFVRNGKYAEIVHYSEAHDLAESTLGEKYREHGGRDKLARHAAQERGGNTKPKRTGSSAESEAQKVQSLLTAQPIGSVTATDSAWAWLRQTGNDQADIIPLPADCAEEINRAIIRILTRQQKGSLSNY